MHPNPLLRMLPDGLFDEIREHLRVLNNVNIFISGNRHRDLRQELHVLQPILAEKDVCRNHGRPRFQRENGCAYRRGGGHSKEIYKHCFDFRILINKQSNGTAGFQHFDEAKGLFTSFNGQRAMQIAVVLQQVVESLVFERGADDVGIQSPHGHVGDLKVERPKVTR